MLKWFIDSNGNKIPVEKCIKEGALANHYPLSYLQLCADEREWKGTPSTTQLINGTRLEYLKILTDFALDPGDQSFRVIGTKAHKVLEDFTPKGSFSELSASDEEITGIADLLEQQPNGKWWLVDYKTWGSYKVALALGLEMRKRPAFDEFGNPELYQRGGKGYSKGDQKQETYYVPNSDNVEMEDAELQLNRYRMLIEKCFDIEIEELRVFAIVRDGNTHTARGRGIHDNTYYIPVRILENDHVDAYFSQKRKALLDALSNVSIDREKDSDTPDFGIIRENCPTPCTAKESWEGRRCNGYCPVSEVCAKIGRPWR